MRRAGEREREELRHFSLRRGATLADDLDILLGDLCRLHGFCNHLSGHDLVLGEQPLTADAFAKAVLIAEGFPEPSYEVTWSARFQRIFTLRYGGAVSASEYRSC